MKRIKARNFDEFFASHMGMVAWRRANAMFEAAGLNGQFVDGRYRMILGMATFEIPKRGGPQVIFEFEFTDEFYTGQKLRKVFQVDKPEGLFALLKDYTTLKLAFDSRDHVTIEACNNAITTNKPICTVLLSTNQAGFQSIRIESVAWKVLGEAPPPPEPPKMPVEPLSLPDEEKVPLEPETPPEPILEPKNGTTKEVSIGPGVRIAYKIGKFVSSGLILKEDVLENGEEVALVLDDGAKEEVMVRASNITAVLDAENN